MDTYPNFRMMEFFENIITGEKISKYKTNYFHMIVDADVHLPNVEVMSDEAFGTLIHEYVHYIQHISTLFGIRTCNIFHKISIIYRAYISEHDTIKLPLQLYKDDTHICNFLEHYKKVSGSKKCNHNVDAVDVTPKNVDHARINHTAVAISCYDFENDKVYEDELMFGSICVMEGMAHVIQKLFVENVNHSVVPYCAAELVLNELYPDIVDDKKFVAAICFCALQWDNPGFGFFEVIKIAKENPEWDGLELYKHIAQDYTVNYIDKQVPMVRLFRMFLEEFKKYLANLLGTSLDYYQHVINRCLNEAAASTSLLLEVLYKEPLDDKKLIWSILANNYGYPLIEANNLTFLPNKSLKGNHPKLYLETAVLLGWELLLTRFAEIGGGKECCHFSVCKKGIYSSPNQCAVTEECVSSPWTKTDPCLFSQCMKYFKFEGKNFIDVSHNCIDDEHLKN